MPLIESLSGIRGTLPDALTDAVVARYVKSFCAMIGEGCVVVGRDGRPSGKNISDYVVATLLAMGRDVVEIGVVPTPTVQMEILRRSAAGGIAISASHNPAEWNGLKFLAASSLFLSPADAAKLIQRSQELFQRENYSLEKNNGTDGTNATHTSHVSHQSHLTRVTDAIDNHIAQIISQPIFNLEAIRSRKFKVVVDAVNAAGSVAIPKLLKALGCAVVELFCDGSGIFPHTPEPLPQHLGALCSAVRVHGADLGVAVDPDSDRLVLITNEGVPFGEEYTIVACVEPVLKFFPGTPVVINLSTTRAVAEVAMQYGSSTIRTPVGEINVALAMRDAGAMIGGEGSGGVIFAPLHLGRDALVGCALILQSLTSQNLSGSALRASLPTFAMIKHKIALQSAEEATALLETIAAKFSSETIRTDDGVHITFANGDWLHARRSNTEPIVRVIAEARTTEEAERLVHRATQG